MQKLNSINPRQIDGFGYFLAEDDWMKIVSAIGALDALADLMDETGNHLCHAVGVPVDSMKEAADRVKAVNPSI